MQEPEPVPTERYLTDKEIFDFYIKVICRDTLTCSDPNDWIEHPLSNLIAKGAFRCHGTSFDPVPIETILCWLFEYIDEANWVAFSLIRKTLEYFHVEDGPYVPYDHAGRVGLVCEDYKQWGREKGYLPLL